MQLSTSYPVRGGKNRDQLVRFLQQVLKKLFFHNGSLDHAFQPETVSAASSTTIPILADAEHESLGSSS
jgi:hypothetical protein